MNKYNNGNGNFFCILTRITKNKIVFTNKEIDVAVRNMNLENEEKPWKGY